jgi:TetR/AcrR family transcriptional repressor of nem operon
MARPREFNTDQAIVKAAAVFWEKGYEDASLTDLLDGMGITRGSLYKAFTDKKSLFLRVLDYYETAAVERALELLTGPAIADGRLRIRKLFAGLIETVKSGDTRGCLLCTASAGSEMDDPEIAAAVYNGLSRLQGGIDAALKAARGPVPLTDKDRLTLSDTILTQYIGLRILARSRLPLGIVDRGLEGVDVLLGLPNRS